MKTVEDLTKEFDLYAHKVQGELDKMHIIVADMQETIEQLEQEIEALIAISDESDLN